MRKNNVDGSIDPTFNRARYESERSEIARGVDPYNPELRTYGDVELETNVRDVRDKGNSRDNRVPDETYLKFLDAIEISDINLSDWNNWQETRRTLVGRYFPKLANRWKDLENAQYSFRFNRLVGYARKRSGKTRKN